MGLLNIFHGDGDGGLGIGDWGLGIGPNPQSPIPNPQSPIPKIKVLFLINFKLFNGLLIIVCINLINKFLHFKWNYLQQIIIINKFT